MKKIFKQQAAMLFALAVAATFGLSACGEKDDGPAAVISDTNYEWLDDVIPIPAT